MIYTTLNKIRQHSPCESSWIKLLESLNKTKADDDPLSMVYILDTLGMEDCLWAMRSLPEYDREWRLLACVCAESVLHYFEDKHPGDKRPRQAIEAARSFANGEITSKALAAAGAAAEAAAWAAAGAAWAAAEAAAGAAGAAAWEAGAAAWEAGEAAVEVELRKVLTTTEKGDSDG